MRCYWCGEPIKGSSHTVIALERENGVWYRDEVEVCEDCYHLDVKECEGCGQLFIDDFLHSFDGELFCEECYEIYVREEEEL